MSQSQNRSVRFDLLSDWLAEDGKFGTGVGFTESGALYVPAGATIILHLTNGVKIDRALLNAIADGGVIVVDGILTVSGDGVITGGNSTTDGGGILVNGTLTLEDGVVTDNHANNGGGIYVATDGTLNLQGGMITANTADIGSGIYAGGKFTLQGGAISNNVATTRAGVYVAGTGVDGVQGLVTIAGNVDVNDNRSNLVFGGDTQTINFTGAMTNGSQIFVTPRDTAPVVTSNFAQAQIAPTELFGCDNNEYAIFNENGEVRTMLATDLQVKKPQSVVLTYTGKEQVAITDFAFDYLTYSELPDGLSIDQDQQTISVTKVGTYTFTVTPHDGYIWEIVDGVGGGNAAVTVTIEVKPMTADTIIWRIDGEVVDRVEYTGAEHFITAWLPTADGEMAITDLLLGDKSSTNVGEYTVAINPDATDSIDFANTALTFSWGIYKTEATVHYQIDGKDITITEYTGEIQRVSAYLITASGKQIDDVAITRETAATAIDNYQAELTSSVLANFTITNDIVFKWSIVAKQLDLQWLVDGNSELPENNQITYDGNEHRVTLVLGGIADGEKVTALLSDDSGTDVGEHVTRLVGLSGLHASNYTYDVFAALAWSIVPLNDVTLDVNWSWSRDQYYVGETLTADVLAGTTATAEGFDELTGTVTFLTADGKLILTEPNQTVEVKFTPNDARFSPVRATLTVPSKYIEVTFAANDGTVGQVTRQYNYHDAVVFVDKLTREHYTHVGWSTTQTNAITDAELSSIDLVQLDGDVSATADETYYAVWCYTTYTIRFYTNNPLQYTTLSNADGVEQVMTWTATTGFTQANHGTVTYDAATNCYVYEYNHADWQAKSTGDLWFTAIQWNANTGFAFDYWADANGERCDKISNMQNLDLYAQWLGRNYVVRFVDGETTVGTGAVTNGATLADAPTLASRTDANFAGWFINADAASDPDNNGGQRVILGETLVWVQGELPLYAGWTQKQVVVEFPKVTGLNITVLAHTDDTDKELTSGDYLDVGTTLTIRVTAEDGYRYTGLQITVLGETQTYGADEAVVTYNIAGYDSAERRIPLLISGTAEVLTYNIIYDTTDDWSFISDYTAPNEYDLANNVILPSSDKVARLGYTFAGWVTADGTAITNTQGQLGDLTLYPRWTADAQTIVLYKGGQAVQTITSMTGAEYPLPDWSNEVGFENFTFQGWSETADLSNPRAGTYTVKAGANNLYAVWAIKTGALTLNVTGNNAIYNFGETVITLTANSTQDYNDTQHGLVLSYTFTNLDTGKIITNADGKLALSQVAESGRYYCALTITAPNYAAAVTIESAEQTITVQRRDLSGATYANMVAVTYTGVAQTPALPRVTLDGVPLSAGTDFDYVYTQNITVGTAHLVITGQGNFTGTADQAAFTIEPAKLSVLVNRYTGVYDGKSHEAIASKEATSVDGATVVWSYQAAGATEYSSTMPTYANASTYIVYYRVECANHETVDGSIEVQIDKYQTAVIWETTTFEYDGKSHRPTATATGIGEETVSITLYGDNPTAAGNYTVTASTSNQNYRLTNATTDFVITPRKTTVTITPNGLQRADEKIKYAEAVIDNPAPNEKPSLVYTYYKYIDDTTWEELLNHALPTEAGTYAVYVAIEDTNYELTGLDNAPFIILGEDATITNQITVDIVDWIYGDEPSKLLFHAVTGADAERNDAQITYYQVASDGTEIEIDFADIKNVGTYRVRIYIPAVEWDDETNYGRTEASASADFRVLPRELTLTWSDSEYTYDGEQHTPTVTLGKVLDDDVCDVTVQIADGAGITVGKYTVTVTTPTNANYVLPNETTHEFTIIARQIKVTIIDQNSEYGDELATLVGKTANDAICGDDNVDGSVYTLTKEAGLTVGTYRITGSSTNANYAVTFVNATETRNYGQYTITAQEVNVVWDLAENYTYTGTEQTVQAHVVDKYNGQIIALEVTTSHKDTPANTFKAAGDYLLTARDTTRNYNLSDPTTTVTIERALLTITADDLTVRYGEAFNLTATVTGLVDGEDETVLQGGQIVTDYQLNDDIAEANTYLIDVSGYHSDNYTIEYVAGTLTVEGIYLQVQINDQTSVYGNSILAASYTFLGEGVLNPSQVFVIEKAAGIDVGEYKLTGRVLNRNYGVEFVTEHDRDYGIYTITPRAITVEINDQHSVCGENLTALTANVAYDAIIGLDNADGSVYTLTKEDGNTAGEYRIMGTTTNPNYAVTFTATNAERDYGIYLMLPTATMTNVYNGENQPAFTVRTIDDATVYAWLFSTDGENFTTTQPRYKKPGEYTTYYRIVAGDAEYTGTSQWQIVKATLTVVIGENTVVKGQSATLDAFTVTGLGTGDDKMAVIAIVYTDSEYDAENAAVGDTFALSAVLRDEYADCYELVLVEPNTLTVVAIVLIKKKQRGGKSTKSGNQTKASANELPLNGKDKN